MTIKTIMTQLTPGVSNSGLLHVTETLAEQLQARVIGIAACKPSPGLQTDGYLPGSFVEDDLKELHTELAAARGEFEAAFPAAAHSAWQSETVYEAVADYVARAASAADLVVTYGTAPDNIEMGRRQSPGNLVMQAGRPVLIVPQEAVALKLGHVVLAWKDTREARRAALDALPVMAVVASVTVLAIAHDDERAVITAQLDKVVGWLGTHGITATSLFAIGHGNDAAELNAEIMALDADLVVAGAYGHSRIREWVFGGVTRDVMLRAPYCALLSH